MSDLGYGVKGAPGAVRDWRGLSRYVGLTYPRCVGWMIRFGVVRKLWERLGCTRRIHLFDECASSEHYLNCDICGLRIHIAYIESCEEACKRANAGLFVVSTATEISENNSSHHVLLCRTHDMGDGNE